MEIYRNKNNDLHREHGPAVVSKNLIQYVVNKKLHRSDGPAVITKNGGKMYYWRGVPIEPSLWHSRDTISVAEILRIRNIELRRCLIEMIGYSELVRRGADKLIVLDEDKETGAILYRLNMPADNKDEAIVVVKVIDGTTLKDENNRPYRKEYFIRVPPDNKTCKDAIAWTFGMSPDDYKLEQET